MPSSLPSSHHEALYSPFSPPSPSPSTPTSPYPPESSISSRPYIDTAFLNLPSAFHSEEKRTINGKREIGVMGKGKTKMKMKAWLLSSSPVRQNQQTIKSLASASASNSPTTSPSSVEEGGLLSQNSEFEYGEGRGEEEGNRRWEMRRNKWDIRDNGASRRLMLEMAGLFGVGMVLIAVVVFCQNGSGRGGGGDGTMGRDGAGIRTRRSGVEE